MSLNWLEINRVLEELPLEGAFLQNIRQSSYSHLIFEFHRPGRSFNLLISLDRNTLRLHKFTGREPSLPKPPRFTSYMRSRIKGARVLKAEQLGCDRIVRLDLKKGDNYDILYIRLWGGASNLILCTSDNRILDAFSRRPARKEVPGELYLPEEGGKPKKNLEARPLPEGFESYSAYLQEFYAGREETEDMDRLRERARKGLQIRENAVCVCLKNLEERLASYADEEIYRNRADILMSCLHLIKKGETSFTDEASGEKISLDSRKTAVENAQDLYKKASKASRGRELVEEEVQNQRLKLKSIEQKLAGLDEISDPEELKELAPREQTQEKKPVKTVPGLQFESGGFTLIVGRSAKENEELLSRHVRGNDYWLHTRDYPGAYVFVRRPKGKTIPLEVLLDAGNLALFYSKAKASGVADLYYTQVKYLRKPREGKRGLVLPTQEKNLHIKLEEERISRLKGIT